MLNTSVGLEFNHFSSVFSPVPLALKPKYEYQHLFINDLINHSHVNYFRTSGLKARNVSLNGIKKTARKREKKIRSPCVDEKPAKQQ